MPTPPYFLWDHWYIAARSEEISTKGGLARTIMDTRIALYRTQEGRAVAISDRCPHLGASLAQGRVKDGCLHCPFHGWVFDQEGRCRDIPALGEPTSQLSNLKIRHYPTVEAGGLVWVFMRSDPDKLPTTVPIPRELNDPGWGYGLIEDVWPTNYTRFIENMLDMVHLPYVHAKTIGRFVKARGPLEPKVTEVENGFDLQDGQLTFRWPNVHRLSISPKMINYMWGVPVSATETRIYILAFRKFARIRALNPVFDFVNRRILNEDRGIILSQEPKYVTYGPDGDLLMRPDTAARMYRRLLEQQLDGSKSD